MVSDSFATPWAIAQQAPLSMEFPRHEYWSGLPFPTPGDLPDPRIKHVSPALAGGFFTIVRPQSLSRVWLFVTPWTVAHQPLVSMELSRQNIRMGCCSLLQRLFLTQGLNPSLLHCKQFLCCLSYREVPKALEIPGMGDKLGRATRTPYFGGRTGQAWRLKKE